MNDAIDIDIHVRPGVTLDTCDALAFPLFVADGSKPEVIVWRDSPSLIQPIDGQRLRDLRPGDRVQFKGEVAKVIGVKIYR